MDWTHLLPLFLFFFRCIPFPLVVCMWDNHLPSVAQAAPMCTVTVMPNTKLAWAERSALRSWRMVSECMYPKWPFICILIIKGWQGLFVYYLLWRSLPIVQLWALLWLVMAALVVFWDWPLLMRMVWKGCSSLDQKYQLSILNDYYDILLVLTISCVTESYRCIQCDPVC